MTDKEEFLAHWTPTIGQEEAEKSWAMKGVVTVDTATAHLAGALGVKCIVLMPRDEFKCWRWKHGSWYDSVIPVDEKNYDQIPELIRRM